MWFIYLDFLAVIVKFCEKILGSLFRAFSGHFNGADHGTDAFVKVALGLEKGIGGFKVTFGGKMTEHFYFFERKPRFPALGKELHPISLLFPS
jgi:hypothetical protein